MADSAEETARQLIEAGVRMLQYRSKSGSACETLGLSRKLAAMSSTRGVTFFVNDRPDIAFMAGAAGVHVGQADLSVEDARAVVGSESWIGVSTHNELQFRAAIESSADYIAVGPVFPTKSKVNPDPVIGTEFIGRVRRMTNKPIVAIGGITAERAAEVIEAGADSVAVISDILKARHPGTRASQYLDQLQAARSSR
jgi:thiamine-phosphate pyrophosphorylase